MYPRSVRGLKLPQAQSAVDFLWRVDFFERWGRYCCGMRIGARTCAPGWRVGSEVFASVGSLVTRWWRRCASACSRWALGHEDPNEHDALRRDSVVQTACGRDEELARFLDTVPIRAPGRTSALARAQVG